MSAVLILPHNTLSNLFDRTVFKINNNTKRTMKTVFYLTFLMSVINLPSIYPIQEKLKPGDYQIGQSIYRVSEATRAKKYVIYRINNPAVESYEPTLKYMERTLVNRKEFIKLVTQTLGDKVDSFKESQEKLRIEISFYQNGKPHAIGYVFDTAIELELNDIVRVDEILRKQFIGEITSPHDLHKRMSTVPFVFEIDFLEQSQ